MLGSEISVAKDCGREAPLSRDDRILARVAEGKTDRQIAKELGLTKGTVSGVRFRARGGAQPPRPPKLQNTVWLGNYQVPIQAMSTEDKERQFQAHAEVDDGGQWWVAVPHAEAGKAAFNIFGRRVRRPTGRHFPLVSCRDEAEARRLSYRAWGFR